MGICIYLTYSDALFICYQWARVFLGKLTLPDLITTLKPG